MRLERAAPGPTPAGPSPRGTRAATVAVALALGLAVSGLPARTQAQPRTPLPMQAQPPAPTRAAARCFELAGRRYGVPATLLRAVAQQESGMNPRAFHRNANGSWDTGLMQINSRWLPLLARHGIQPQDLWEPCTNIMVGAWVLGTNFRTMGPTLRALGAYNAADPARRERYARQVLARLPATPPPSVHAKAQPLP